MAGLDVSSLIGGVGYNTSSGGPSGLFASLDPKYQLAQTQAALAKQQLSQEQAFAGGFPTDPQTGQPDYSAAAQQSAQLGDFNTAARFQELGFDLQGLNLAGRYAGAFGGGGQGASALAPRGTGALPAAGGGMIAPSAGGDDNGIVPSSGAALGGGGQPATAGASPPPSPMDVFAHSIGSIESSNRYDALGQTQKNGDLAYGRYQVMGSNIPSWTQDVLGQSLTPQQFLASPQAQDAVFQAKFGGFIKQYGSPADAASVWFSGRPLKQAGDASDSLGTTAPAYVQKFLAGIGPAAQALRGGQGQPSPNAPPTSAAAPSMPVGGQSQPISFGGGDASSDATGAAPPPASYPGPDATITDAGYRGAQARLAQYADADPASLSPAMQRRLTADTGIVAEYERRQAAASSPGTVGGAPASASGEAPLPGNHPFAPGAAALRSPPATPALPPGTPPAIGGGQAPQGGGFQPISFGGGGAPPAPPPAGMAPQGGGVAPPAAAAPPPAPTMPPNVAAALARLQSNQGSPADGQLWGAYQRSLGQGGAAPAPAVGQGGVVAAPTSRPGGAPVGLPVSPSTASPQTFGTGNTPLMNDPGVAGILRSYKGGQFVGDPGAALMDMRAAQMALSGGGKYANPMAAVFGKTGDYLEQAITRSATLTNEQRNARDPAVLAELQQRADIENNVRLQADIDPRRIGFAGQQAQATAEGTATGQNSPDAVAGRAANASAVAEAQGQGKYLGGLPGAYAQQADAARATSANVDQMLAAAQGFRMGAGSQIEQDARKTLQGTLGFLGASDPKLNDPTASYEDFGKMAGVLNRNAAQQVGGRTGVQEMQLIASTLPSPEMSYDGFRTVAASLKGSADFTTAKQQAAQDWIADPAHKNSLSGFEASFNRNTSPSAFWLNRLQVDQPDLFQRTVQGLGQTTQGRALLVKAKSGMAWANTNGLLD